MSTSTTQVIVRLQPGQPDEGMDYNPRKPLPYPIHVGEDGRCENVPFVGCALARGQGYRPRLIGFQATIEPDPTGLLLRDSWLDGPIELAVGMYPVFTLEDGGMANLAVPITSVTAREVAS